MSKVVIDFGHGGADPGAVYNGRQEKDDVLMLGLMVGKDISRHGVGVQYTRSDDKTLSLAERSAIERVSGADCFLSIHRNATPGGKGVETFCYPNSSKGNALATLIQNNIVNAGLATADRGVKTANFHVLRETKSPSALVEVGFIDSDEDNALFDARIVDYADAIAKGMLEYLGVVYKEVEASKPNPTPKPQHSPTPKPQYDFASLQREFVNQGFGNISVDNIPGPRTLAAAPTVKQGARGNITRWIQARLIHLGYSLKYGADGIFGEGTRQAIMAFQRAHGLSADGIIGKNTWRKLLGL